MQNNKQYLFFFLILILLCANFLTMKLFGLRSSQKGAIAAGSVGLLGCIGVGFALDHEKSGTVVVPLSGLCLMSIMAFGYFGLLELCVKQYDLERKQIENLQDKHIATLKTQLFSKERQENLEVTLRKIVKEEIEKSVNR